MGERSGKTKVICGEMEGYNRLDWAFEAVRFDDSELSFRYSGPVGTMFKLVTGPDICLEGCSSWMGSVVG